MSCVIYSNLYSHFIQELFYTNVRDVIFRLNGYTHYVFSFTFLECKNIWASSRENLSSEVCEQKSC